MSDQGGPSPDLLVSGEERAAPARGAGSRRAVLLAGVLAVTVGVGVLVSQDRARDERRRLAAAERDVVRLSLLAPGQDGAPRYGPRRPGIQLVVANAGPAAVRLRSGALVPGDWEVAVPDRELRAGRSVVVEVRPPQACVTPEPRSLQVRARSPSGRPAVVAFDLAPAQLAYGGTFADALAAAALACDAGAALVATAPDAYAGELVRPSR